MNLKQQFAKWRKMPLKELILLESNMWFMMSNFGQQEQYASKHGVLSRLIKNYEQFKREISPASLFASKLVVNLQKSVIEKRHRDTANFMTLIELSRILSS